MSKPLGERRRSHAIRLAAFMLVGAFVGQLFVSPTGRLQDQAWINSWIIYPIVGAVSGMILEICKRLCDSE
jgi:hypothetical protein